MNLEISDENSYRMCEYQICGGHGICDIVGCHRHCVVEEQGTEWYVCLCQRHAEMLSDGYDLVSDMGFSNFRVRNDQLLRKNHHETDKTLDEDDSEEDESVEEEDESVEEEEDESVEEEDEDEGESEEEEEEEDDNEEEEEGSPKGDYAVKMMEILMLMRRNEL